MELPSIDSIGDILSSLSAEDMENLSRMASTLLGAEENGKAKSQPQQEKDNGFFANFDIGTISRIMVLMEKMRAQQNGAEYDLLCALKPMLSPKRQKRADEAMGILRLISLLPLIESL